MNPITLYLRSLESRIAPATFVVTSTADAGNGSLREALALADAQAGRDTIRFRLPAPAANGVNTILLTSGTLESDGDVSILGPGAGKLILDGGNTFGVLSISDGAAADRPTTLAGISIVRGNRGADVGGGIRSFESLTLNNVVITGCTASTGGALRVGGNGTPIAVRIVQSRFERNTSANSGGAADMVQLKSALMIGSSFLDNTAASEGGGALVILGSQGTSVVVSNCAVVGNRGSLGGGLIVTSASAVPTAKVSITNSVITGNVSTSMAESGGGGMFLSDLHIAISRCNISNNQAAINGGGVMVDNFASLTVSGSNFGGNVTTASDSDVEGGGGLYIDGSGGADLSPATVAGCTFANNSSAHDGGGMVAQNGVKLTLTSTRFLQNRGVNRGGGLRLAGDGDNRVDAILAGCTFTGNFSDSGGGIRSNTNGSVSLVACNFLNNEGTSFGGGFYISRSATGDGLSIRNTTVIGNTSAQSGGGQIENIASFRMIGGAIRNNSAANAGGIRVTNSTGTIDTLITGNSATEATGGLEINLSTLTLRATKVFGNIAAQTPNIEGTFTPL